MAQTPRGNPRSISDQARDVYAERLRRETEIGEQAKALATKLTPDWDSHPGFAESLIPVWGSGREAIADFREGDYVGAGFNGALAASDLFLAGGAAKGLAKGAINIEKGLTKTAPYEWRNVRRRLGKEKFLELNQEGHHWLIPQGGPLGRAVPHVIKNQRWNIMPMPNTEAGRLMHARIHRPVTIRATATTPKIELKRYNAMQRYIHGTPTYWKSTNGAAAGHAAGAVKAEWDKSK
jgi:hypothetical protein